MHGKDVLLGALFSELLICWMAKTTTKMWQSTLLYDFVSRNLRYSLIVYLYNMCMIPDDLCVRSNYECPGTSDNWIRLPDPWFIIAQPRSTLDCETFRLDCETSRSDCEASRTDCETSILKLESRIVKLENQIVKL